MKRLATFLLTTMIAVGAFAGMTFAEDHTIGFCMASLYSLPGHYHAYLAVQEKADEEGWTVVPADLTSVDDVPKICENFISAGCDVVLMHALYREAMEAQLPAMLDAGITVASIDGDLTEAGAQFTVYCDNYNSGYTIGTAAAEWAKENIEGKVYAGCLNYNQVERFAERGKGEMDALKDILGDNVEIVGELDAGLPEEGMAQAENMLSAHPDMNLMVCWNGTSGIGAHEALKSAGWNKKEGVGLFDIDAGSDALAAILEEGSCFKASLDMGLIDSLSGCVFKMVEYVENDHQYPEGTDESYYKTPYPVKPIFADEAEEMLKLYE